MSNSTSFRVDLSQTKQFKLVAEGEYLVRCVKAELVTNSKGNPMVKMQYEIVGVTDGNEPNEEFIGQRLFDNLFPTGGAAWKMGDAMEAMWGFVPGPDEDVNTDEFIDDTCLVDVVHEVWAEEDGGDGQPRAKIGKYKSAGL